jgi:hypothetical protein
MNTPRMDPETFDVGPLVVNPVAPPEPIKKAIPKPSPEDTSEFWKHVIR